MSDGLGEVSDGLLNVSDGLGKVSDHLFIKLVGGDSGIGASILTP